MSGSSIGHILRMTTAGESHGPAHVVIVDGCPPGIPLSVEDLQTELFRRRPGQSSIVTSRKEADFPEILSGVFLGETTGTSIAVLVRNQDTQSSDYDYFRDIYRPGHADYTYQAKYGVRDYRGGGRSSARETVSRVIAGVIAKKIIARAFGGVVIGYVIQVGTISAEGIDPVKVRLSDIEEMSDGTPNVLRCPDHEAASRMLRLIEEVKQEGDSIGGLSEIVAHHVPPGLGEPVFDKLKADLAKALFSIPAVMAVEYGNGMQCVTRKGSQQNDTMTSDQGSVRFTTNRHGGMLGGISSGAPILLRAAVKAPSSIRKEQDTVDALGNPVKLEIGGRHDPCVVPRFVPIAEAMVAFVIADHWLRYSVQRGWKLEKASKRLQGSEG